MVLNGFKTVTTQEEQNLSSQIPARPLYLPEIENVFVETE